MSEQERVPAEVELTPEDQERLEELVESVGDGDEDIEAALGLDEIGADPGLDERIAAGRVTETDMIAKARTELYKLIGTTTLGPRDLLAIYVRGLALEEQRLKSQLRKKGSDLGVKDLREKARKAGAGQGG